MTTFSKLNSNEHPVVQLLHENPLKMWSTRTIQTKLAISKKRDVEFLIRQAIRLTKDDPQKVRQVNPLEVGSNKEKVHVFTIRKYNKL